MTEMIPFRFHEDELSLINLDGKAHLALKPALESIGLDAKSQIAKLNGKSWSRTVLVPVRDSAGRTQQTTVCDIRTFLMLLATVDERRVADSVRPKLIKYQAEIADAIESYWVDGGAINSRATADQLNALIGRIEGQARVLSALRGVVDKGWLDAKGRHLAAQALGEEPEIDPLTRPLTVGEFLEAKGVTGEALRSLSTRFGKQLKAAYIDRYDRPPTTGDRFVGGAMRQVAIYTERHRPLFDRVWQDLAAADAA